MGNITIKCLACGEPTRCWRDKYKQNKCMCIVNGCREQGVVYPFSNPAPESITIRMDL
jgi:hypothetical protein